MGLVKRALKNRISRLRGQLDALDRLVTKDDDIGAQYMLALAISGAAHQIILSILEQLVLDTKTNKP